MYLVLFDVDGTLVDSRRVIVESMTRAFAALDRPAPDRATTLAQVGLSLDVVMRNLLGSEGDEATVAAACEAYKSAYFALRAKGAASEPLFPGARAAIEALSARDDVVMGLATGKSMRGIRALLDRHDLHGRFATLQCADDHPSKPHPSMILAALAATGVAPEKAAMIGDTVYDVEMGAAAGVVAIGVAWGFHPCEDLVAAGADRVIDDFATLEPTLSTLLHW